MKLAIGCLVIAALASAPRVQAQPGPTNGVAADAPLDAAARKAIVAQLAKGLRQRYVFPDVGLKAADMLTSSLRSGAYAKLTDRAQFASRLDADLAAVTHDKHLHVEAIGAPPTPGPPPPRDEHGVVRADRLRGGIGYIEILYLAPVELFKPTIDRAMTALAGSKALIIDDRLNGGGDPASETYVESFLTPPGKVVHIDDMLERQPGTRIYKRQALDSRPTPVTFAGLPAYVLTSHETFSGGEALAYNLQSLKLATVVGEVTGGGANPTSGMALPSNLLAYIPFGRPENPITKTNWEGRGVQPDIKVPAREALRAALSRLGQPSALDVASVSEEQVFTPRTTPAPGSEKALRDVIETVASGAPDYASMTPEFAEEVRANLRQAVEIQSKLGRPVSIRFQKFDGMGDVYDVTYAGATWRYAIALAPDGKVFSMATPRPLNGEQRR